ncbi:MAG: AAA family ATPase [Antricoccus sp.]
MSIVPNFPPTADDLDQERHHLELAETCLDQMRQAAELIGDAGSDAWTSEILGRYRAARLEALKNDSHAPAFFGRIDLEDRGDDKAESFHIGRRHVRDQQGDPIVIDWRAPMSEVFYQATSADPRHLQRRRRFGFARGELTSYEDERLLTGTVDPLQSKILLGEIERPRVGPMRDIVATIQPDQDDIVRSALDIDVCVQGAPGTGKTAVGLHRAAYLLYAYPAQLRASKILIVGPNTSFLSYIAAVLPALGEFEVDQASLEKLTGSVSVRSVDSPEVARLKGDARLAPIIERALRSRIIKPRDSVQLTMGDRKYRVPERAFIRYVDDLRRSGISYTAGRERLALALAEDLRRQREASGGAPSDAEVRRCARSRPTQAAVDSVWPAVTAPGLVYELLSSVETLRRAANGDLTDAEVELLAWTNPPAALKRVRWSLGETVLIDEAAGLLDRVRPYGHVVLDEAQDLSPMQCRAVARRSVNGSLTILGDIAQGTSDWSSPSWEQTLEHLGRPEAHLELLTQGYRVPGEILTFANRLLPTIAPQLPPATSVRPGVGSLHEVFDPQTLRAMIDVVQAAGSREGTTGVICARSQMAAVSDSLANAGISAGVVGEEETNHIDVVPADLAKGLEFDQVVLMDPELIIAAEDKGLNRLYVCLTRAVSDLTIVAPDDSFHTYLTS